jgi:hypothetical protein
MKGSGGGYGFARITRIGASLEEAAARADAGEIRSRCDELDGYLAELEGERA